MIKDNLQFPYTLSWHIHTKDHIALTGAVTIKALSQRNGNTFNAIEPQFSALASLPITTGWKRSWHMSKKCISHGPKCLLKLDLMNSRKTWSPPYYHYLRAMAKLSWFFIVVLRSFCSLISLKSLISWHFDIIRWHEKKLIATKNKLNVQTKRRGGNKMWNQFWLRFFVFVLVICRIQGVR